MTAILIAFASREGQTRRICQHIAQRIEAQGNEAHLVDLTAGAPEPPIPEHSGVIIAGSVHRGRVDQALSSYLMRNAPALGQLPSAFLSVSLSAASVNRDARAAIDEITQQVLYEVGWHPDETRHLAGAVDPAALNLLERCAVHAVTHHHGIDMERDGRTELTDWTVVDGFVSDFLKRVDD